MFLVAYNGSYDICSDVMVPLPAALIVRFYLVLPCWDCINTLYSSHVQWVTHDGLKHISLLCYIAGDLFSTAIISHWQHIDYRRWPAADADVYVCCQSSSNCLRPCLTALILSRWGGCGVPSSSIFNEELLMALPLLTADSSFQLLWACCGCHANNNCTDVCWHYVPYGLTATEAHLVLHSPYKLPDLFRYYIDKNDDIHSHNTRLKDSVHLYRPNTGFGKRSLKYKAAKFYSNLPEEIRFDLGDSVR